MQKSIVAAVLAVTLSASCRLDVDANDEVVTAEKKFQVTGQRNMKLHTFDGSIEVRGWDRNEVSVDIRRRVATDDEAREIEVTTTQEGNRAIIDARGRQR